MQLPPLSTHKKTVLRTFFRFMFINLLIAIAINYLYILFSSGIGKFLSIIFIHTALFSNTIQTQILIALPLFIILLFTSNKAVMYILCTLSLSFLHIVNLIDIFIYRHFNFHINSMVLNLLASEGAEDSLRLGAGTYITATVSIVGILFLEFMLIRNLYNRLKDRKISSKTIPIIFSLGLLFIITDKLTYAVADLYNRSEVTRYSKVFPLYQPMTIKRMMRKKFGFKVDREKTIQFDKTCTGLNYPKNDLNQSYNEEKPNIVWIMLDAWRFDMFTEEVTPNIKKFSENSLIFNNHFSGGNASRFGVFTLFYAIHGYYWHYFLGERRGPVFMDELIKLGYDFKIISSRKLSSPEFRSTVFVGIPEFIDDDLPGKYADEKDPLVTERFLDWLDKRDPSTPFFSFMFFNASHRPYKYPDEFDKFKPSNKNPNYLTVGKKDAVSLMNSYKNAIHFEDNEIGKILRTLEEKNLLTNTIILITGDHGEEFYETGFWGHTSAFSKYQTKVPLILYIPGKEPEMILNLTSHLDVVPTMFELLGNLSNPENYSQGQSLLNRKGPKFVVSSGWDDCAIIDDNNYLVFSFETYNLGTFEVRDSEYKIIDDEKKILKLKRKNVIQVLNEFKEFMK